MEINEIYKYSNGRKYLILYISHKYLKDETFYPLKCDYTKEIEEGGGWRSQNE